MISLEILMVATPIVLFAIVGFYGAFELRTINRERDRELSRDRSLT